MNFQLATATLLLVVSLASVNASGYIPNGRNPYGSNIFPSPTRRSTSVNPGEFSEDTFNQRYQETQNRINEARKRFNRSSQEINRSITTANGGIDLSSFSGSGGLTGTPFSNRQNSRSDLPNAANPFDDSSDEEQERRRLTEIFASTEGMVGRGMFNDFGASLGPRTNRNLRNMNPNETDPLGNNYRTSTQSNLRGFGGDIEESNLDDFDQPAFGTFGTQPYDSTPIRQNLSTSRPASSRTSFIDSGTQSRPLSTRRDTNPSTGLNNNISYVASYKIPKHVPWILTILAVFTVISIILSIIYAQKEDKLN